MRLPLIIVVALLGSGCAVHSLKPFSSDACSLYPEGTKEHPEEWKACCVAHDRDYWQGGTRAERKASDQRLRECVLARTKDEGRSQRMYRGVRLGGSAALPTPFRWGYGWGYGRGYETLTPEERAQVEAEFERAGEKP